MFVVCSLATNYDVIMKGSSSWVKKYMVAMDFDGKHFYKEFFKVFSQFFKKKSPVKGLTKFLILND